MSQSDEYQKRIDEAADYKYEQRNYNEYSDEGNGYYDGWSDGAQFVRENPPPEVEALVEALKRAKELTRGMLESYCKATNKPFIPENYLNRFKYINETLAAFEKARGDR